MEKIWEVAPKKYDDIIKQLLYNRGIIFDDINEEEKRRFFHPDFDIDMHDPFLMKDLKKAVLRIAKAKESGEKIGIYSDYDADGVPAAALLYRAFCRLNILSYVYIPNRESGYGLSKEGIDYLRDKGCSLIITADLGIKNFKEAKYCRKIGIDLIITDHHLPDDEIPKANFVINPKIKGNKYPFLELSGCSVVFKVLQGLSHYCKEIDQKFLKWNLDLVAIATISDVVPLVDENRVIANYGLIVINKTKNIGLAELIKVARLSDQPIGSYHVGFQIAPRINAPGRMDHATKSFELLVTCDAKEAKELAHDLNEKNESRQRAMEKTEKEAVNIIEKNKLWENKIIVLASTWQKGIIGPTASRIVEKYARPVILFSKSDDKFVGSARSISGVNIVEIIEKIKDLLIRFGGHKRAAGVTVSAKNYDKFANKIIEIANAEIPDRLLVKKIRIDAKVLLGELSKNLYEKVRTFEPFGMGNSKPIFMAEKLSLINSRFVGKDEKHLSFLAGDGKTSIKSICFNSSLDCETIDNNKHFDIAFSLDLNKWNGNTTLNLKVVDIRKNTDNK